MIEAAVARRRADHASSLPGRRCNKESDEQATPPRRNPKKEPHARLQWAAPCCTQKAPSDSSVFRARLWPCPTSRGAAVARLLSMEWRLLWSWSVAVALVCGRALRVSGCLGRLWLSRPEARTENLPRWTPSVCLCCVSACCRRAPSPLERVQDFSIFADGGHWFRVSDFAQNLSEWYAQAWRCVLCGRCLALRRWSLRSLAMILGRRRPSLPRRLHLTGCDMGRFLLMTSPWQKSSLATNRWR